MGLSDRVFGGVVEHRRILVAVLLVTILGVASGVSGLEQEQSLQQFEIGVEEEEKLDYVESNFSTGPENQTVAQVIVKDDNVLAKESLIESLELQKEIRTNATIGPTLREDQPTVGIANVIATTAIRTQRPEMTSPTLDQQIAALEAMDQEQIDAIVEQVLDEDRQGSSDAFALMPNDYESGSTEASSTMIVVFQTTDSVGMTGNAPDSIVDSQLTMESIAADSDAGNEIVVVGNGLITDEQSQSQKDSIKIVGPLALLFVVVTLILVYRDLLDIVLSLVGVVLVQLWTFGALGWVGIPFNPVLIAIPVLLMGLSIDYCIHVFMRYREHRSTTGNGVVPSMKVALIGVGVALVWVTMTTAIGFLSNLVSPVQPVQELGIIAAIGIVGAFVVFALLLPPLKAELDALLERFGLDRNKRAIGTGSGRAAKLLSLGSSAARKAPVAVILLTLLLTAGTTLAATQVSTSFEPEDNIAEGAPEWTESLPEGLQPSEYSVREDLRFANENFVRHDSQVEFLIEGDVTNPDTLQRIDRAVSEAGDQEATIILANGEPRTESLLTVMERVAARDDSFRESFAAADTDGDGVPDQNLEALYDELYEVAPDEASSVLHREDGEYVATRMAVSVNSEAQGEEVIAQMDEVTAVLEGDGFTVTATGEPIINQLIQDYLLETLLVGLLITLLAVVGLLMIVYRVVHDSATLGLVTMLPVLFVVSWIIATMYFLGYPLSVLTTIVASVTIGIGIDYSIHISERFSIELEDANDIMDAIVTTTKGTGSALLGSAVTTAAGFGVLGFSLFPTLQQFGTITAIMIVYAFLGSVLVLPSMLVVWARYLGPDVESATEREVASVAGEPGED
ncbi:Patched family protein [Halobacteriales archaeon QS_1_68_20]|nr:MAG: Patched family protein [Halobacteriales archaeon QS_1_68_20]